MEYVHRDLADGARIAASRFRRSNGATEVHLCIVAASAPTFREQVASLHRAYSEALIRLEIAPESAAFARFFLSDAANQAPALAALQRELFGETPVAQSRIEQAPIGRKLALWAYHIVDANTVTQRQRLANGARWQRGTRTHLWFTELGTQPQLGPAETDRTTHAFQQLVESLAAQDATLRDHAIRTWIYLRDVDAQYATMLAQRRAFLGEHGLTRDTHFITSTGIEGRSLPSDRAPSSGAQHPSLSLDAYAIAGLTASDVRFLRAPALLGQAADYGATFERGTCVTYGDRRHSFIAGTASIDRDGRTLHIGDVRKQAQRTLANIDALLADAGARRTDVAMLLVYLRDPTDRAIVEECLTPAWAHVPQIHLRAAVCRPEWLVEVECIAITSHDDGMLEVF